MGTPHCMDHCLPKRIPELSHDPKVGEVPLGYCEMGLLCSPPPSLSHLHLLTFGGLISARPKTVRKPLPLLPPLLSMLAHLPYVLQAGSQSRFDSSEDSDPTTSVSGW